MPAGKWELRINDIIEAIEEIQKYTEGMDISAFSSDLKTVDAVIRNITVIGEAANHVRAELSRRLPKFPGRKCAI